MKERKEEKKRKMKIGSKRKTDVKSKRWKSEEKKRIIATCDRKERRKEWKKRKGERDENWEEKEDGSKK